MSPLFKVRGKCSSFGGPNDSGVSADEGLAFIWAYEQAPYLFLDQQPSGTTGLARRLNPDMPYVACRWDYNITPKDMLAGPQVALVIAANRKMLAFPADWGPHHSTDRVADLSPGLLSMLNLKTDDEVEVIYPAISAASEQTLAELGAKFAASSPEITPEATAPTKDEGAPDLLEKDPERPTDDAVKPKRKRR